MALRFEDPPPAKGGKVRYVEEAAELRSRPGEWALLDVKDAAKKATMLATSIRAGNYAAFRDGFEAASRRRGEGEYGVYVRYVGE